MEPINDRDDDPKFWARYPHPNLAKYLIEDAVGTTFRSVAWPAWGLIYHLVRTAMRPDVVNYVVELGVDKGITAIVINQACVDLGVRYEYRGYDREPCMLARERLVACGFGPPDAWIVQTEIGSEMFGAAERTPLERIGPIAFAFVDFSKGERENTAALQAIRDASALNAMVLVDNAWCEGVYKAVLDVTTDDEASEVDASAIWLPRASWGFWPQRERGGTPGMALLQWKDRDRDW